MIEDDDDLPVLTQVLRIGSARAGAMPGRATNEFATDDGAEAAPEVILLPVQLVIGTEPRQALEPYVPLTTPTFDPTARHDGPHARSSTHGSARSLIVPFTEPVDAQSPSDRDATLQASSAGANTASDTTPSDSATDAAPPDSTIAAAPTDATDSSAPDDRAAQGTQSEELLVEEADPERRNAANDAHEDSRDPVVAIDPSTPAPFDHDAFAVRVREAVLNDLSARIDTELDARIAETLRAELEAALASLQDNLREQLAEAMRDVVRRAVEEQVARLREPRSE